MATTVYSSTTAAPPAWNYQAPAQAAPNWNYYGSAPPWSYTPSFEMPELQSIDYAGRPQVDWNSLNAQAGRDLEAYYKAQSNNAVSALHDRGMAGTTVAPSIRMGYDRERSDAWSRYKDANLNTELGYETKWWEDAQNWRLAENQLAGQMAQSQWGLQNQAGLAQQQYGLSAHELAQQAALAQQQYGYNVWNTQYQTAAEAALAQQQYQLTAYNYQNQGQQAAQQMAYQYYNTATQANTARQQMTASQNAAMAQYGAYPDPNSPNGYSYTDMYTGVAVPYGQQAAGAGNSMMLSSSVV